MTTKTPKLLCCTLLAALTLAACSGSPDLCTRSINAAHKIGDELIACEPDAGIPPDTEAATEIAHCETQLAGCTAQDQSSLTTSVTCIEDLPPLQCQWFTVPDGGLPVALLAWAFEALTCEPTPALSASCQVTSALPLDGGLSF